MSTGAMSTARSPALPALAGALTVGAGLVHATAAGSHAGETTLVALMAVTALAQVAVGIAAASRPSRRWLGLLVGVNLVAAAAWALSRTTGLPLVDGLSQPEAVGLQDLTAMVLESAGSAAGLVAAVGGAGARRAGFSPLWTLALLPALVGMTAPHTHDDGQVHAHASGDTHRHVAAAAAPELASDPVFAGADTSHTTEVELAAAKGLIESTRTAAAEFPDKASLLDAGYRSIGDGFPFTRHEHFVNSSYLNDGREVDPAHVESFVMDGPRVVSAMYILEQGKTMSDVPDIAGQLTTWHDHQDLCWEPSGLRLAGVLLNGRCVPGGTLRATPPMLHVWLTANECGPFAGIDGHPGAPCAAGHTH